MTGGLTHRQPTTGKATGYRSWHLPAELQARIMFIESIPGGLLIDALCIPYDPPTNAIAVSLEATIPPRTWAYLAAAALERWASAGLQVSVRFRWRHSILQASISDQQHTMLLDLRKWPHQLDIEEPADNETP